MSYGPFKKCAKCFGTILDPLPLVTICVFFNTPLNKYVPKLMTPRSPHDQTISLKFEVGARERFYMDQMDVLR
jgi:hypothetical protein